MLEHIFDGEQTRDPPKFIDHHGQVVAIDPKVFEQLEQTFALGHHHHGSEQGAQVQIGRALTFEQIFGEQYTDDVITLGLVHGIARVGNVDDFVENLL